jgi:hypothetical protein
MSLVLVLVGLILVVAGVVWRLTQSPAATSKETLAGAAGPELADGKAPTRDSKPAVAVDEGEIKVAREAESAGIIRGRRHSDRVLLKIPLEVAGTNAEGESFTERTETLVIGRSGAFFYLQNSLRAGDQITITNLQTKQSCPFRAVNSKQDVARGVRAWGVECLEPERNFWQICFPQRPKEPSPAKTVGALLECAICHSREMTRLSTAQYSHMLQTTAMSRDCPTCGAPTPWEFAFEAIEEPKPPGPEVTTHPPVPLPEDVESRRKGDRIVALPIWIRHEDGRGEIATTESVSKSDVCFAADMQLEVGELVFVTFQSTPDCHEDETPARIMWRHQMSKQGRTLYGVKLEHAAAPQDEPSPP